MTRDENSDPSSVRPGAVIGSYRIEHRVAEGGMGVIYRAFDTKLERPVAIKLLSNELADAAARRRFQREAQLASSLNHPHILTIHDVGEIGGRQYLVMEWIDGGTLQDWAAQGPRSWRQVVETLVGVADGLATAHEAGILHRDVKPENLLVGKNGYAKLGDFGVAKLGDGSDARTATQATRLGVVIGSPGYMSPEQTAGRPLDARSDIFSFGIILYELLSGRRPFTGTDETEIARAVVHDPAPPLPSTIPIALRIAVDKALEKDPADRYQTMRDLVVDLRRIARRQTEELEQPPVQLASARTDRRPGAAFLAVTVMLVAAAAGGWAAGSWLREPERTGAGLNAGFRRMTDFVGMEEAPAASPDGKSVAFTAAAGGRQQIWLQLLAGGAPLQITHEDADHEQPRWTPDSSALIYFVPAESDAATGTLWEVPALGGPPRRIAPSLGGADVSHDGRHIATFQTTQGEKALVILTRDGSSTETVKPLPPSIEYRTPRWSPDDGTIAFTANESGFHQTIYLVDVAGGEPQALTSANDIRGLTWRPDGSGLVYASSQGTVLPYPPVFSLRSVSRDDAVEQQLTGGDVSYVQPDMTQPGTLFASRVRMQSDIWRFPTTGAPADNVERAVRITRQTGQVQTPSVSPDGKAIAYLSDSGGHSNVWVTATDGSNRRQLTFERDPEVLIGIPNWSPAGDRIVYIRTDADGTAEWLINPDGSGLRRLVTGVAARWSRDGQWLYFASPEADHQCISKIAIDSQSERRVRCDAAAPQISADGTTLYFSPSDARLNVLMKATPEDGPAQLLASYAQSRIPAWPTNYALSPDDRWLAVPLRDGRTTNLWAIPTDGSPIRRITDFGDRATLIARQVSWSPDGESIYAALVETDADIVQFDDVPQ